MSGLRSKFAVQKPKGTKWETLALVDDPGTARREYADAVGRFGRISFVRLIEVQFKSWDVLADYDWRLIELHDPLKRTNRPNLKMVQYDPRTGKRWQPAPKDEPIGGPRRGRRPGERVPIPLSTYVVAFLIGALAVAIWGLFFQR